MLIRKNITICRTLLFAFCLVLATLTPACKVTTPGGTWEVTPVGPGGGNGNCNDIVGHFTDGETTYELIDTDCDGKPDYARNPQTGKKWRIEPGMANADGSIESIEAIEFASEITPAGSSYLDCSLSDADREELNGLAVEPETTVTVTRPVRVAYIDTDTDFIDVSIEWTKRFIMPSLWQYDMKYELYDDLCAPDAIQIRMEGHASQVLSAMAEMGFGGGTASIFSYDELRYITWTLTIDSGALEATIEDDNSNIVRTYTLEGSNQN